MAIKNVVYWPQLDYPGEQPNKNPTLAASDVRRHRIRFYGHRDETTVATPIRCVSIAR